MSFDLSAAEVLLGVFSLAQDQVPADWSSRRKVQARLMKAALKPVRSMGALLLVAGPGGLARAATVPLGGEFRANEITFSHQHDPSVALLPSGEGLVVWESWSPSQTIEGRIVVPDPSQNGPEFTISRTPASAHEDPDLALGPSGRFFVAWKKTPRGAPGPEIVGQWYSGSEPAGDELVLSAANGRYQYEPAVAVADERIGVVWMQLEGAGQVDVYGRLFDLAGAPVTPVLPIATTSGPQVAPSIARVGPSSFVTIWLDSALAPGQTVLMARPLPADGEMGPEFMISPPAGASPYTTPGIVGWRDGGFVAVWTQPGDAEGRGHTWARRYSPAGRPGPSIELASYPGSSYLDTAIAAGVSRSAFAAWTEPEGDDSGWAVAGSLFSDSPSVSGRINTFTAGDQYRPAAAGNGLGLFLVCWNSRDQDGSGTGVYCQFLLAEGAAIAIPALAPAGLASLCALIFVAAVGELRRRARRRA